MALVARRGGLPPVLAPRKGPEGDTQTQEAEARFYYDGVGQYNGSHHYYGNEGLG
jgi:hypothetical protein